MRTTLLALLLSMPASLAPAAEWVHPGPDGKLVYKSTDRGDHIMDFSHAGYMGGGVALPDVPVVKTLQPSGADDTKAIQAAIDEIATTPPKDGHRGALLLAPGTFTCSETLTLPASGIVLRGSGADATTIKLTGEPHVAIAVRTSRERRPEPDGKTTLIADAYVPSGSSSFNVADAAGLAVGDWVAVRRPVTQAWVHFMGMDDMTRDGKPQTWLKVGSTTDALRQITKVDGNTLTLDVPLSDSFDAEYLNPPGTTVAKIPAPDGLSQVGIENLHIESPLQAISHTQPHFSALRLTGQDCWVRDVNIDETMNSVGVTGRRITLQRVAVRRRALHQGASKPAEFAPNGTQVLLDRCSVTADAVWYVATGAGVSGPIVVLNSTFTGNGRSETHQRWSTGMLYDNCRADGGGLEFRNRGSMGSGHGWTMGWGVIWNCAAKDYIVQNPPGAFNWLIGSTGENKPAPRPFGTGPELPAGVADSPGKPAEPKSLYLTQLAERLGPQAVRNLGYDFPSALP